MASPLNATVFHLYGPMSDSAIYHSWTFVAQSISCGDLACFLPAIVGSFSLEHFLPGGRSLPGSVGQ
jgi:hypothetical protein